MADSTTPRLPTSHSRFVRVWLGTLVLVGGVLFPLFTLVTLNWFDNRDSSWIHQLYLRKSRSLAARPPFHGPRLLIFGGSATVFGLDAELIEKDLGSPAVNMATHGSLGLDYQIARVESSAKKGDSVLLVSELEAYGDTATPTELLRDYAFSYDKSYILKLPRQDIFQLLFLAPFDDYIDSINRWDDKLAVTEKDLFTVHHGYVSMDLSPNGDMRGLAPSKTVIPSDFPTVFSPHAKESLTALARWSRQRGVRLLFTWPNRIEAPVHDSPEEFQIYKQVAQFCKEQDIPIIGPPEESIYPKELFIDSVYHLNEIGRRIRTKKLIAHLHPLFESQPSPKLAAGPKTVCVMAARTPLVNQTTIFDPSESIEYKYLSQASLHHPDCITLDDLRSLARAGARITCIDDATEAIATAAGFRPEEIKRRESSFADWVKRYDHHLFLMSLVDTTECPIKSANLPEYFAKFMSEEGFRIGMIGTGRLKGIHRISSKADGVKWSKRREPFSTPTFFNLQIALASGPISGFDKAHPPIVVENERLADLTPGLAVCVLDPDLGIVVAQATFQHEPLLEWKLQQLAIP